jgi:hypothetical protein
MDFAPFSFAHVELKREREKGYIEHGTMIYSPPINEKKNNNNNNNNEFTVVFCGNLGCDGLWSLHLERIIFYLSSS